MAEELQIVFGAKMVVIYLIGFASCALLVGSFIVGWQLSSRALPNNPNIEAVSIVMEKTLASCHKSKRINQINANVAGEWTSVECSHRSR